MCVSHIFQSTRVLSYHKNKMQQSSYRFSGTMILSLLLEVPDKPNMELTCTLTSTCKHLMSLRDKVFCRRWPFVDEAGFKHDLWEAAVEGRTADILAIVFTAKRSETFAELHDVFHGALTVAATSLQGGAVSMLIACGADPSFANHRALIWMMQKRFANCEESTRLENVINTLTKHMDVYVPIPHPPTYIVDLSSTEIALVQWVITKRKHGAMAAGDKPANAPLPQIRRRQIW